MNHPEKELNGILDELRNDYRNIEAPPLLEERLAETARLNAGSAAAPRWRLAWGLGFALVAIATAAAWWLSTHSSTSHLQQIVAQPAPTTQTPADQQAVTASQAGVPQEIKTTRHIAQTSQRPRRQSVQDPHGSSVAPDSSVAAVTSFLPLPASEGLPEPAQQTVVRARILTSSLAQYGLDVPASMPPQLVSAEFLVGEDGLPRAIRFVR